MCLEIFVFLSEVEINRVFVMVEYGRWENSDVFYNLMDSFVI